MADGPAKRFAQGLLNVIWYTEAEAVLSFAAGVPAIIASFWSVLENSFSGNPQVKPEQHSSQNIHN